MHVISWLTTLVALLFRLFRRRTVMCLQRIEAFEDETAVVTEQLMQSKHSDKENRIIVIPLNPLTLAPWTLHTVQ
jgi:hypothetical protein